MTENHYLEQAEKDRLELEQHRLNYMAGDTPIDAMNELEAIEEAHRNIVDKRYRVIIYRRFLQHPPAPNWVIGQELGYARTRFQELVNLACLAFAENYRNGELIDLLE